MLAAIQPGLQAQGWYGPSWQYRKPITITGGQIAGNLSDFPVLISLTDADLSARALANGFDILFTDADGTTKLDHERTRWVSGTGELIAWVKVTSLTAGVDKTIYIYYGNTGAADQQNAAAVWSNGYEAVYHLDDDFTDATGKHAPGINTGSVDVTGRIGDGQDFEQTNNTDHIDIGNWSVAGSQLTIQSWVRYESFSINDARIVSKALDAAEQEHVFMLSTVNVGSPTNWRMRLKTGTLDASGTTTLIQPTNTVNLNTWYLTAATYDGSTMRLLQNGGQVASVGKTGNLRQNGWSIYLGNNPRNGTTPWYKALDGILDEVRISTTARPSSWLTTEYNNQRPGATFYGVGPEQPAPSAVSSALAEIAPNDVVTSSIGNAFTYDILATIGGTDTGVDRVTITVPSSFGDPTVTDVKVGGSSVAYTNNTVGKVISVDLTTKVTSTNTIQILFTADAPTAADGVGQSFTSTVDDSGTSTASQNTSQGNADGDASDNNSWTVTTTGNRTQTGYAWSDDVASFTSKGNDATLQFQTNSVYILAIQVAMTSTVPSGSWVLQVREDGVGAWLDVLGLGAGQSQAWQTYNVHTFAKANGAVVLTTEFGNTSPPVGFTAVDGEFSDDNNGLSDGYTGTNIYTELQYAIRAEPAAAGHTYEFRVDYQGAPLNGGYSIFALAESPSYGVVVAPNATSVARLPSNGTTYTVDFTVINQGNSPDAFDLLTTGSPGTTISVVSMTGAGVTQGANPDSAQTGNLAAGDSTIVTVTYSVAGVAEGTIDTLLFTARSLGDPATSDDGQLELTVIRPNLTNAKTVSPSGTQLPGTDLTYTLTLTNTGSEAAESVVNVDSLPGEVQFKVGTVVNNFPAGIGVTVEYSDDGGSTWTYTPVSLGCGAPATYDACVTHIRWTLQDPLSAVAPDNTGTAEFVARIK